VGGAANLTAAERDALVEVEPDRWDELVRDLGVSDVYYARGYVESAAALTGGAPAYLHLPGRDGHVLFCCLVRSDPADVVSPYGYGGPLGVGASPPLDAFAAAYDAWCGRRGVVSSFVTYHPLFANQRAAQATGFHAVPLRGTVAWALGGEDLLPRMHRHHRRLVRRAQAQGLEVSAHPAPDSLDAFAAVYEATMRRAGASPFYFFGAGYWRRLVADVPLVRVDVRADGDLAASVLGMGDPPWLHYHLGGSTDAGRRAGASQLALLGLASWGREQGYDVLHLGGGVGGREDSLFEYKLRFAPEGRVDVAVGKAVHDLGRYEALAGAAGVDWDGFFPAYRAAR
jgi:GNAT acetyltransferase-like protein